MDTLTSPPVAQYVEQMFESSGDVEPENLVHMAEMLDRDINMLDIDRYANPLMFVLPMAISPSTGSRSSIATYINSVVRAGSSVGHQSAFFGY